MDDKTYSVTLEINAKSKEDVDKMLDGMPHAERIFDWNIEDPDEPKLECRIRFVEDWNGEGEHYVFENKWTNEEEWGLDTAYPLISYEGGNIVVGRGAYMSYQAITKIRELIRNGIHFYFC